MFAVKNELAKTRVMMKLNYVLLYDIIVTHQYVEVTSRLQFV